MAKQTFTTGQVLTAAQMTSLQQTAMLGGDASAKVASYVLVAADAGTAISMSNGSATTITVNTGLFAAGDIVTIINLGAGVCTITAGTATVTTSGSLALAQNQGGVLRFTSASAAIFFQFATPASGDIEGVTAGTGISGGGTSGTVTITNSMATAIDAKGDLIVGTGADTFARLGVGTNGHTIVADSGETTGLKWVAPAAGGGLTLLDTLTLSGASTNTGTLSTSYVDLYIVLKNVYADGVDHAYLRLNSDSNSNYAYNQLDVNGATISSVYSANNTIIYYGYVGDDADDRDKLNGFIRIPRYNDTGATYCFIDTYTTIYNVSRGRHGNGVYDNSAGITSITFYPGGSVTFQGGTAYIYGVK